MWLEGQVVGEELKDKLKTRYTMGKCESRFKTEIYLAFKTFDN